MTTPIKNTKQVFYTVEEFRKHYDRQQKNMEWERAVNSHARCVQMLEKYADSDYTLLSYWRIRKEQYEEQFPQLKQTQFNTTKAS